MKKKKRTRWTWAYRFQLFGFLRDGHNFDKVFWRRSGSERRKGEA